MQVSTTPMLHLLLAMTADCDAIPSNEDLSAMADCVFKGNPDAFDQDTLTLIGFLLKRLQVAENPKQVASNLRKAYANIEALPAEVRMVKAHQLVATDDNNIH